MTHLAAELTRAAHRVGQLYTAARDQGLDHGQAEELARNLASAIPGAIVEACEAAVRHRVENGWLKLDDAAVATLARALAESWDSLMQL